MGLLQSQADVGAAGAGGVVMDDAGLVATIHVLTRATDRLGRACDHETDGGNGAVTCPDEVVAAFGALGQDVIDQAGLRGRRGTRIRPTEYG